MAHPDRLDTNFFLGRHRTYTERSRRASCMDFHPEVRSTAAAPIEVVGKAGSAHREHFWCTHALLQGTYAAVGCDDGALLVWDMESRALALELDAHDRILVSVAFGGGGRLLATAGMDSYVRVWKVYDGVLLAERSFESPILAAVWTQLEPALPRQCVNGGWVPLCLNVMQDQCRVWCFVYRITMIVLPWGSAPLEWDVPTKRRDELPLPSGMTTLRPKTVENVVRLGRSSLRIVVIAVAAELTLHRGHSERMQQSAEEVCLTVSIAPSGTDVVAGTNRGRLLWWRQKGKGGGVGGRGWHLVQCAQPSTAAISRLSWSTPRADTVGNPPFVAATKGRTALLIEPESLSVLCTYGDPVSPVLWTDAAIHPSGRYVATASADCGQHQVVLWTVEGQYCAHLVAAGLGATAVAWHPTRPWLLSAAGFDGVLLWRATHTEHWSAFAPGFTELMENVEYVEREDEFDRATEKDAHEHWRWLQSLPDDEKRRHADPFIVAGWVPLDEGPGDAGAEAPVEDDEDIEETCHDEEADVVDIGEPSNRSLRRVASVAAAEKDVTKWPQFPALMKVIPGNVIRGTFRPLLTASRQRSLAE